MRRKGVVIVVAVLAVAALVRSGLVSDALLRLTESRVERIR